MKLFKLNNQNNSKQNFSEINLQQKLDFDAQKLVILPGAIPSDEEVYYSYEEIEKNAPDFFKFINDAKKQAPESWNVAIFGPGFRDLIVDGVFKILNDMLPENILYEKINGKLPEIILASTKSMNQNILNMTQVINDPDNHCFEEMSVLSEYLFKDCIFDAKNNGKVRKIDEIAKNLGKIKLFAMSNGIISAQELQNALYLMLKDAGLAEKSDFLASKVCLVGTSSFFKFFHPGESEKFRPGFTKLIAQTIEDIYAKKYGQVFSGAANENSKEIEIHESGKNLVFITSSHPYARTYKAPGSDELVKNAKDGTYHRPEWLLLIDPTLSGDKDLRFNSLARIVAKQICEMLKSEGEVDFFLKNLLNN